jgi:hypothetical protein
MVKLTVGNENNDGLFHSALLVHTTPMALAFYSAVEHGDVGKL